ncbi:MAG: hypothetical protein ACOYJ1_08340 [Peptococcales bacterium]|jgi:hypothetical protein
MDIKWFTQANRGRRTTDNTIKITFTVRPKGIRFNSAFTKALQEQNVQKVDFGYEDKTFFIKPNDEGLFTITTNKKGASSQVCASAVGMWAIDNGITGQQIEGKYNEKAKMFEFNINIPEEEIGAGKAESATTKEN